MEIMKIMNRFSLAFLLMMLIRFFVFAEESRKLDSSIRLDFWNNPEFVKRFMGSYGVNPRIEPEFINPDERTQFHELGTLIRENPEKAIDHLERMITDSSSAILPFTLGAIYFQEGETTKAIAQFEIALSKFPDFRRAHRNLGFALAQESRYEAAAQSLTRALILGASDASIYGLLGFAYLNSGKMLSAEAAYRNALLLDPENADWKLGLTKAFIARSNYSQAAILLDELLANNPQTAPLWSLQANVFLQMEKPDRAAVNFEMLRKLGKAKLPDLMLLGDIYMIDEAMAMALPVYEEAVEHDGKGDIARSLRASENFTSRSAWTEAERLFSKIRQIHGENMSQDEEAKLLRLESKVAMGQGKGEEALAVLEAIIKKNPLDGEALLLSGGYYSRKGQKEQAIFRYEMAAKISGFEADAWLKHAQLLVEQRDYHAAIALLKKAQKLKPRAHVQKYLEAVERVARASTH